MDDLISRAAAINAVRWIPADLGRRELDDAIKALKQLPSARPNLQPTCNQLATDCISRQAAIDAVNRAVTKEAARWSIQELPSARPTGRWIKISADKYTQHAQVFYRCDKCGADTIGKQKYCPNCGARMEVEHE